MKKWQKVFRVSSSELEEPLLNDCDEAAVDFVACRHEPPVLELPGKSVAHEANNGIGFMGDSNRNQKGSKANGEDNAERIRTILSPLQIHLDKVEGRLYAFLI